MRGRLGLLSLLRPMELILLGLCSGLCLLGLVATVVAGLSGLLALVFSLWLALVWIPSYYAWEWLAKRFEHRLKGHVQGVLFGLGLALIVFAIAPINVMAVARSVAFYNWAELHAPHWLASPFLHGNEDWEDSLEHAVLLFFVWPSLLVICPSLTIALLMLSGKARTWGRTNLGLIIGLITILLGVFWLGSVVWIMLLTK